MAVSIGVATFIENEYDTITAKELVYNAKWFELILFLLLLNFINNIKTYQLLKWKKMVYSITPFLVLLLLFLEHFFPDILDMRGSNVNTRKTDFQRNFFI